MTVDAAIVIVLLQTQIDVRDLNEMPPDTDRSWEMVPWVEGYKQSPWSCPLRRYSRRYGDEGGAPWSPTNT